MYDERFCRMWEFYLISAEMMFRTGSQLVFHMQLARKRDAAPILRDYVTDLQRQYRERETDRLEPLLRARSVGDGKRLFANGRPSKTDEEKLNAEPGQARP